MADDNAAISGEDYKDPREAMKAKNYVLTALLFINAVMMGCIAYFQWEAHEKEAAKDNIRDVIAASVDEAMGKKEAKETGEALEEDGILFPLESFTANLAQGDGPRRYLRLNAVLKFSKDSNEEEFKARKPQIRDSIISILNSKRPEDLLKMEGKNYLKEEVKSAINTFLVDGEVIDVYYVGFQVN